MAHQLLNGLQHCALHHEVAREHAMVLPQTATTLRVVLTTAAGAPVTDLADWLGMPGHAIVLSENGQTFIHPSV